MAVYEVEAPTEVVTEREQRARTLEAAALEIDVRGWTRNKSCDEKGRVCAEGAIAFALGNELPRETLYSPGAIFDQNARAWGGDLSELMEFNDWRARSAEEVKFLLRWRADEIRRGF